MTSGRLVIVEDDPFLREQLTWSLKKDFDVTTAADAVAGSALCAAEPDLYLLDMRLPPSNQVDEGLRLLEQIRARDVDATVIMMSGEGERAAAVKALQLGAFDFFQKPVDASELRVILKRALERRRLVVENRELKERVSEQAPFDQLVGKSAPMRRLFREIQKVAPSDATILLQGESGTGKELVAHAIHARSPRSSRPFVAVNASALAESLAEAELFGHEKGAFTGAIASRPGRFEMANRGTLFLDEIGTLSAAMQSRLLRVLQSREVERVGGRRSIPVDFRLISATNEDLEARVADRSFREDLFYRINTIPIRIPPLRDRRDDIPLLAEHFLQKFTVRHRKGAKRLSPAVLARLDGHPWRGNVRELEHVLEMLVLFADGEELSEADLPRALRTPAERTEQRSLPFAETVAQYERKLLSEAIAEAGGVKARAARNLGLDPNQIKYLCRKHRL